MPVVKIELDQHTYETLIAVAIREWRPTQWQAEVLLRRAIYQESSAYEPDPEASQCAETAPPS
jgi:hypothetical protein